MPTLQAPREAGHQQAIVADRKGVIIHWGTEVAKVLGYSSEEALGETVALIIPPVLQGRHWLGFNRAVSTGQLKRSTPTLQVPAIHKRGAVVVVKGTLTLNEAEHGSVDTVTLMILEKRPAWTAAIARIVLAALKARQAVDERIRPASRTS